MNGKNMTKLETCFERRRRGWSTIVDLPLLEDESSLVHYGTAPPEETPQATRARSFLYRGEMVPQTPSNPSISGLQGTKIGTRATTCP